MSSVTEPDAVPAPPPPWSAFPPHPEGLPPYPEGLPPHPEGYPPNAEAYPPNAEAYPPSAEAYPAHPEAYPQHADAYPAHPEPDRFTRFFQRAWSRSPVWVAPVAMLACMGAAAGYTLASHPTDAGAGAAPTCLLKYTTGFVCPGCGGTRAAWYLLHGDLPAAARHHAIFVFAVPFLLYMYVAWAGRRMFGWRLPQLTLSPRAIGIFLAVWGVWSVLRNLPWAPFTMFYV